MTLAATVLADLVLRGVRFLRRDDLIGYQPAALVTAAEREALCARKPELLALLDLAADLEREGEGDRVRALYARLTDDEKGRLKGEARAGDATGTVMLILIYDDCADLGALRRTA
jgi:hypothetical protein